MVKTRGTVQKEKRQKSKTEKRKLQNSEIQRKEREKVYSSREYILSKIKHCKDMADSFEEKIENLKAGDSNYKVYKNRYPKSLVHWLNQEAAWEEELVSQ